VPHLKIVTRQALAIKEPEFTLPTIDNTSISTALTADHTSLDDTHVLQELARDGARRLLRTLTQDSPADRELRASVAFYIRTESAHLISSDNIQPLNTDIPVTPSQSPSVRINYRLSSTWKWATVAGITALGVFIAPQLQHTDKPATPLNASDSKTTNPLTVAAVMPIEESRISAFNPATIIDSRQDDNNSTTLGASPTDIVTEANPSSTTAPLTVKQDRLPEKTKHCTKRKRRKRLRVYR